MRYIITFLLIVFGGSVYAHTLWLNTVQSNFHKPPHVLATIGWGHMPPMDDIPQEVAIEEFSLVDPELKKTPLAHPAKKVTSLKAESGLVVKDGDLGAKKFVLNSGSKQGTYQISLKGKGNYYTNYIDKKGRAKWAIKPKDEIADAKEMIRGMLYKAFAVSYFTVDKWTKPKSLGYDLEIIPVTDLSDVKVGDLVEFEIFFRGKRLSTSPEISIEYITAVSNSFGGPDKFLLASVIFGGKGQFRMPAAGNWLINVYTRQEVKPDNELKDLVKKCDVALFSSSLTFNVKP